MSKRFDAEGNEVPYKVIDIKRGMIRRIKDQLTKVVDMHRVTMHISVPACGRAEYKIVKSGTPVRYMELLTEIKWDRFGKTRSDDRTRVKTLFLVTRSCTKVLREAKFVHSIKAFV